MELRKKEKQKTFANKEAFWEAWIIANELEKLEIVASLKMFDMIKEPMFRHSFVSLVNSYLVDLQEYMAERIKYSTNKEIKEDDRYGESDEKVSQLQP